MAKRTYAEGTDVSVQQSRAELERLLEKFGATHTAVFNEPGRAQVAFRMLDRNVRLTLTLPRKDEERFQRELRQLNQYSKDWVTLDAQQSLLRWERAARQKWRALVLAVKAKLVAVEEGIETFEEAFMAHVVMPDGRTVAETIAPNIALAYKGETSVRLLPAPERPQ